MQHSNFVPIIIVRDIPLILILGTASFLEVTETRKMGTLTPNTVVQQHDMHVLKPIWKKKSNKLRAICSLPVKNDIKTWLRKSTSKYDKTLLQIMHDLWSIYNVFLNKESISCYLKPGTIKNWIDAVKQIIGVMAKGYTKYTMDGILSQIFPITVTHT